MEQPARCQPQPPATLWPLANLLFACCPHHYSGAAVHGPDGTAAAAAAGGVVFCPYAMSDLSVDTMKDGMAVTAVAGRISFFYLATARDSVRKMLEKARNWKARNGLVEGRGALYLKMTWSNSSTTSSCNGHIEISHTTSSSRFT